MPKYYEPQLWLGLSASPLAHQGVYVDSVFRRCGLWELGSNNAYNTDLHHRATRRKNAIAWGVIGVYAPSVITDKNLSTFVEHLRSDVHARFRSTQNEEAIDLGYISSDDFSTVLHYIEKKRLLVVQSPLVCERTRETVFLE